MCYLTSDQPEETAEALLLMELNFIRTPENSCGILTTKTENDEEAACKNSGGKPKGLVRDYNPLIHFFVQIANLCSIQ